MRAAREKVWVVRPGDGATVGDILKRAGEPASAIDDGRVFLGRRRMIRVTEAVKPGDEVRIAPDPNRARKASPTATAESEVTILFEKDGLVACIKPAGIPTVADHAAASHSLVARVAARIGTKPEALLVTSRLDREVSGVVVFALGAAAEERLRRGRAEGLYERRYVAIATMKDAPLPEHGVWQAAIGRATDPRLRAIDGPDAKPSVTAFARIATAAVTTREGALSSALSFALLGVAPVTGRTHQIRLHASHAGAPLVGDASYGGPARLALATGTVLAPGRIALHAARVVVPGIAGPIEARAPVPPALASLWASLGGAASAWEEAITRAIALPSES